MVEELYLKLGETMAKRGLFGRPTDIPEYFEMLKVLYSPGHAEICIAMPSGRFTPDVVAKNTGRSEEEVSGILEDMADQGLCMSYMRNGVRYYFPSALLPGVIEFQFMRGTKTERDYEIARALHKYRMAARNVREVKADISYPRMRIIPVNKKIRADMEIHTYDQVMSYIDSHELISVATCYCRHEGLLVDESSACDAPNEVCFQFNTAAEYLIERKLGREVTREEAKEILRKTEEAGLVHVSSNTQDIEFICNCCSCHCGILEGILSHPQPAQVAMHSFEPSFDAGECTMCEDCIERCPSNALSAGNNEVPQWQEERCLGCGVCASGCASEAIAMVKRHGEFVPPVDRKALAEDMMRHLNQS